MSRRKENSVFKKFAPVAITAALVVGVATINACTPSDRSTEGREEAMSQNAAEAEAAEAQLATVVPEQGHGKTSKAVAKTDKKASKKNDATVAKKDGHGEKAHVVSKVATNDKHDKHENHDAKAEPKAVAAKAPAVKSAGRHVASAGGVFVVQVGAFKVKENAEKLQAKLKQAGYTVEMSSIEHSKNGLLHLVRTQAVPSKAEAETVVEDLHAKHDLTAQVVTVPASH